MIRLSGMRKLALYAFLLLAAGCSTGVVVHDEDRAAELVVDFLSAFKSAKGIQRAYDWTDDKFKEKVSFVEFSRMVSSIRKLNQGADIRLAGYEIFGPVEIIIVYANSVVSQGKTFFKLVLVGTKSEDYYLLHMDINDSRFSKEGIYNDYKRSILIQGV
jgi:hypothetical protein